jgi:hypothetical protein
MTKLCHVIQTLPPEQIRGVAALLSPIVFFSTDQSLFSETPILGTMLRIVQFIVADALQDNKAAGRIARRVFLEIDEIEYEPLRLLQTSITVPRVLFAEYVDVPVGLQLAWALRLRTAMRRMSDLEDEEFRKQMAQINQGLEANLEAGVDLAGFLFAVVVNRIRSSEGMLSMIDALDALEGGDRDTFVDAAAISLAQTPGYFVHSGWASEQLQERDLSPVLQRFTRMTEIVRKWQRPDVQTELICACSVILDEGLDDRTAAIAVVDAAVAELGMIPALIRQKAKVLGHSDDHKAAALLLMSVEDSVGVDQLFDRALALRDGAVSAARAGLFDDAVRLLRKAHEALAREGEHPSLTVSMKVEIAIVLWTMTDRAASIAELADGLGAAENLEPSASRQNERLHQLLRLVVGLFWNDLTPYSSRPKPIEVIGRATALAGNDPLLGVNLAPLPDVWRMLALCETELGIDAGIEARSKNAQAGPALVAVEIFIARARYARALSNTDLQAAFRLGVVALSASKVAVKLRAGKQLRAYVSELERKSLETLRAEGWGDLVDGITLDVLLWFRLHGEHGAEVLERLRTGYRSAWGQDSVTEDILEAASGTRTITPGVSAAIALAATFAPGFDLKGEPTARLRRDLLLVAHVSHSCARNILEPPVIEELTNGWSMVLAEETFALRLPLLHGSDIEAAIAEMRSSGLRGAARLILAAAPAARFTLDEKWIKFLQLIIEERKSIEQAP